MIHLSLPSYGAILADPPWKYMTWNEKGRDRCPDWKPQKGAAARHYETMTTDEICAINAQGVAAADCCLFLWVMWPLLQDAFRVISAWGFSYKTCGFTWMKADVSTLDMFSAPKDVSIGTGHWTRANSEVCLLSTRGSPSRLHKDVAQGIIEPRREHCRKPDCVRRRIERLVSGPSLELFARQIAPGWDSFGDQLGRFPEATE